MRRPDDGTTEAVLPFSETLRSISEQQNRFRRGNQYTSTSTAAFCADFNPLCLAFLSLRQPPVCLQNLLWHLAVEKNTFRMYSATMSSQNNGKIQVDLKRNGKQKTSVSVTNFKAASLFSGIGGFDLGFEKAGFEITFQCEINEFCRNILKEHWPEIPCHENIKELHATNIPQSDVWAGGFPCQDVSLARMGHRPGLKGKRSGLFYDFARLIGEARPRVVLLENVSGLLSSHGGKDFAIVIQTLAELGYSVGWRVLNSKNFGVPQSRQRVYIVGCYRDIHGPGEILFEPERRTRDAETGESDEEAALSPFKKSIGDPSGFGPVVQSIAYCLYACSARHTGTDWSRTYVQYPRKGQVRRLTPKECEGIMSFPEGWTIPTKGKYRGDDLDSLRYHALGNAVTPPVAEWLANRIKIYLVARRTVMV